MRWALVALMWTVPGAARAFDCDGVGHLERHDCLRAVVAEEEAKLDAAWRDVRARVQDFFGEEQFAQVRDAQRLWVRFRDADCKAMSEMTMVGKYWEINRLSCVIKRTRQRMAYLEDTYLY